MFEINLQRNGEKSLKFTNPNCFLNFAFMKKTKLVHENSNKAKSQNGNKFQEEFTRLTGIPKAKETDKPKFINSHGVEQTIDYDFATEIDGVPVYIDVTTTYRTDRMKQKAYNPLCMKLILKRDCKYYVVVKSFKEKNKTHKPKLKEGLDGILSIDEFVKMVSQ